MQQFRITPTGLVNIKNKAIIRILAIWFIGGLGGIVIAQTMINKQPGAINIWPIVIPVMIVIASARAYVMVKRQKRISETYLLTISDHSITREQIDTTSISIRVEDINKFIKYANGGFIVLKNNTDFIIIPPQIENSSLLEGMLQNIKPLTTSEIKISTVRYELFVVLLTIGLLGSVFIFSSKLVVGSAGIVLISLLIFTLIQFETSKNIDQKTKKLFWPVLIALAFVIARVILVFIGKTT